MLLRPTREDASVIARGTGQALTGLGAVTMAVAAGGVLGGRIDAAAALAIGASVELTAGTALRWAGGRTRRPLSWTRGVVVAVVAWSACAVIAAVPLFLSGHYASYLDALFDATSGLTTTGLSLVQDLDHLDPVMVLYRHVLHLLGGLATVVLGMALLNATVLTASSLKPSDVRDERILPNPGRTWRQVGTVTAVIVAVGTVAMTAAMVVAGLGWRAPFHGLMLTLSAAVTGGFAPTSASVGYYHSALVELLLVPIMLAGALSFAIHLAAWRGARQRLFREIEVRTLLLSIAVVLAIVMIGLGRSGAHDDLLPLFRRGLFMTVSAHTTTGLQTVSPRLLALDWGLLAPAMLVTAMVVGGMSGSTAGGLKVLRLAIVLKGVVTDVRRVLLPEAALVRTSFVQNRRQVLTDAHVRSAAGMLLIVLTAVFSGALLVLFVDASADLTEALFMSASAASNGGLTVGAFGPSSPDVLKAGLLALMLMGRLEWLAVFATAGFLFAGLRGRR